MTSPAPSDWTQPMPIRFWWMKRVGLAVATAMVALVCIRLWWGQVARSHLAAEIAAACARGEPTAFADFNDPPCDPDDDTNAANLITRAEGQLKSTQAQQDWDNAWTTTVPLTPADRTMLQSIVADNAAPLALLRRAIDVPAVNWGVVVKQPMTSMLLASLGRRRQAAELLFKSFALAHDAGDDATALTDLRAMVRLSDAQEFVAPSVVSHLVAIGIQVMASTTVQQWAGSLRIDRASRPIAEALLKQLCDESAMRTGGQRQWYGERLYMLDVADDPGSLGMGWPPPASKPFTWPIHPMLVIDAAHVYHAESDAATTVDCSSWQTVRGRLPAQRGSRGSSLDHLIHVLSGISSPSYQRTMLTHFQGLTERRLAAALLAMRLYEIDHGRCPAGLADLVPVYLSSPPIDPMSPAGSPLRLTANVTAVYSVGEDGIDDGGQTTAPASASRASVGNKWAQADAVCPYHFALATQPAE